MTKPNECKYCGCGDTITNRSDSVTFACRTYWDAHNGGIWVQRDDTCGSHVGDLYRRIKRAVNTLKAARRYRVSPGPRNTLNWDPDPDGSVTDSPAVDEAIAILEGERDGETWHSYAEPPSDTRTVMLRFDQQGNHDCQGFYSYDFGSYARSETNARRLKFVHPTRWRELTEEEK